MEDLLSQHEWVLPVITEPEHVQIGVLPTFDVSKLGVDFRGE
jgi:hypothetical protein